MRSTLRCCPPLVRDLLARGWLRPPIDGELLARARAELITNRETLRKTKGRIAKLEARLEAASGSDAGAG